MSLSYSEGEGVSLGVNNGMFRLVSFRDKFGLLGVEFGLLGSSDRE